jgi:hypothetical protein
MSKTEILAELPALNPEERDEIRTRLDELSGVFGEDGWRNDAGLTVDQKREIERRLAELERNPAAGVPWEEMAAHLRQKFGQ